MSYLMECSSGQIMYAKGGILFQAAYCALCLFLVQWNVPILGIFANVRGHVLC